MESRHGGHLDLQRLVGGCDDGIVLQSDDRRKLRSQKYPSNSCLVLHFNAEANRDRKDFAVNRTATMLVVHFKPELPLELILGDAVLVRGLASFYKDGWNRLVLREVHGFEKSYLKLIKDWKLTIPFDQR